LKIQRILVYTENYLPSIGGLENNTALLCDSLVAMGYRVTLITPQKLATKSDIFTVLEIKSFKFIYKELKVNDLLLVNGGVSLKAIIPAIFCFKPFFIIYQMATLYRDIRNNSLKTKLANAFRKLIAEFAKRNIGVSEYSYLELTSIFGNKKTGLLINPADAIFEKNNETHFCMPLKCLIAGRLIEGKGINLLVEAVKEINSLGEFIHLHVIGDGPEREKIEHLNTNYFIYYHEPMIKEKIREFLSQIHLTIIPSTSHIEGSPLIMAESLAMGVPVLVSSQPAMMASVKNEALIFESSNLESLIEKLMNLTNELKYNEVKKHCNQLMALYSYDNYFKGLKLLLDV
jgi:glycosyltransferase involved in cell wall biosynthesis